MAAAHENGWVLLGIALGLLCVLFIAVAVFGLWYYRRYRNYGRHLQAMNATHGHAPRRRQRPGRTQHRPVNIHDHRARSEKYSVARQIKQLFPQFRSQRTVDIISTMLEPEYAQPVEDQFLDAHMQNVHMAGVDIEPGTTYSTTTEVVQTTVADANGRTYVSSHRPNQIAGSHPVDPNGNEFEMVETVNQSGKAAPQVQDAWDDSGARTYGKHVEDPDLLMLDANKMPNFEDAGERIYGTDFWKKTEKRLKHLVTRDIKDFKKSADRIVHNPLVVIIPHSEFDTFSVTDYETKQQHELLKNIDGAELDAVNLMHIWHDIMGFQVFMEKQKVNGKNKLKTAFTLEDYLQFLQTVQKKIMLNFGNANQYDGLIFVHSGHGMTYKQEQVIFTKDGYMIRVNQIADYFSDTQCPGLVNLPRIFMFCHSRSRTFVQEDDPMYKFNYQGKMKWRFMQMMHKMYVDKGHAKPFDLTGMKKWINSDKQNSRRFRAANAFINFKEENLDKAVIWLNDRDLLWDTNKPDRFKLYMDEYKLKEENLLDNHADFYVINACGPDRGDYRIDAASGIGNFMVDAMREGLIDHFKINQKAQFLTRKSNERQSIRLAKINALTGAKLHYMQASWRQVHVHNRKPKNVVFVRNDKRFDTKKIQKYDRTNFNNIMGFTLNSAMTAVQVKGKLDLSASEKEMRNPLVCIALVDAYNDVYIDGVHNDYLKLIKCFHEKFHYDIFYTVDGYEDSETVLLSKKSHEYHSYKSDIFKIKWSTSELKRFLGVEIVRLFVNKTNPKYDGLILILGGKGTRCKKNVFESYFYDSFARDISIKNLRNTFTIYTPADPNLEFQNISKIFIYDINWVKNWEGDIDIDEETEQEYNEYKLSHHKIRRYYAMSDAADYPAHKLDNEVEEPIEYNLFQCLSNFPNDQARYEGRSKLVDTMVKILPTNKCTNGLRDVNACLAVLQKQVQRDWLIQSDRKHTCMLLQCGEGNAIWWT